MPLPGYAGSILFVDLTQGRSWEEPLDAELVQNYIGGLGINNKLALELIPPGVDPLSEENAIILGAGPFTGTAVPGSGKLFLTTKFPINGAFATASGGGRFALYLKSAGFDHVVLTGKAPSPVVLKLEEGKAEFLDASSLRGKDCFQTVDELRASFEPCSIIPVGPAGENLVKASVASVDKEATLGRGGLPAIMASKNLKAIVALQGAKPVAVAQRLRFVELLNRLHERIMGWPGRKPLLEVGPTFGQERDLLPAPAPVLEVHKRARQPLACPSCPLADKSRVRAVEGVYSGPMTYDTHLWFEELGGTTPQEAYELAMALSDALNRYGLCHMTFSYLFTLACQLYQEGTLTLEDTEGLELKHDLKTGLELARKTAYREGLGKLLAEGPAEFARRLGLEERVEHIKGQALVIDPRNRGLGTMEFEQLVNPRGAHVASGGSPTYEPGRPGADFLRHGDRMGASQEALKRAVGPSSFNPGRYTTFSEDWYALFSSLGVCNRAFVNRFYSVGLLVELYSALTGVQASSEELMAAARRAWDLGRFLNARAGFSRRDDRPPGSWFQPLSAAGKERRLMDYYQATFLTEEDIQRFLDDYYDERGYDKATGMPCREP